MKHKHTQKANNDDNQITQKNKNEIMIFVTLNIYLFAEKYNQNNIYV